MLNLKTPLSLLLIAFFLLEASSAENPSRIVPKDAFFYLYIENFRMLKDIVSTPDSPDESGSGIERWIGRKLSELGHAPPISSSHINRQKSSDLLLFFTDPEHGGSKGIRFKLNMMFKTDAPRERLDEIMNQYMQNFPGKSDVTNNEYRGSRITSAKITVHEKMNVPTKVLIDPEKGEFQKAAVDIPGVSVFSESIRQFHYSTCNDWFLYTEGDIDRHRKLINRILDQQGSSVSETPLFQETFITPPQKEAIQLFARLTPVIENTLMDSPQSDISPLLTGLKSVGLVGTRREDKIEITNYIYAPSPRTGAANALFHFQPSRFRSLSIAPDDVLIYSSTCFNLFAAWSDIMASLQNIYPETVLNIRRTLNANRAVLGFDVERDLLGATGCEMGYYVNNTKDGFAPAITWFLEVEDPERFEMTLERLFAFVSKTFRIKMRRMESAGFPAWQLTPTGPGAERYLKFRIGTAICKNFFILTSDSNEMKRLSEISKPGKEGKPNSKMSDIIASVQKDNICGAIYFAEEGWGMIAQNAWKQIKEKGKNPGITMRAEKDETESFAPEIRGSRLTTIRQTDSHLITETLFY